jgi:O-methyltransferase involved in polyketide biosynthesis
MNRTRRPLVITVLTLAAATAATSATAKVLRSQEGTATVFVFKDAFALDRFSKLSGSAVSDADVVDTLLTCKVAQGSRIIVLGSGYRTAFVRVTDGNASGCEGTVPVANIRDE